ncbi:FMN-dependent NADH-azoreductase [Psychrosphaera aestuarii]|uniref:FMN-dependent NADH-azoreductase n=1 Tax=Psychrosphaera aestuarii TaxID=1266052 RepID=UPI001B332282|nr:NAD(P)H-dependent oxidoreductase [Psychrosphaera aestuarii]
MNNVLVIKSSISGDAGNSTMLTNEFVEKLKKSNSKLTFATRDLVSPILPHLSSDELGAWMAEPQSRTKEQLELASLSDDLISELQSHDTIVIGMPMYNFGIPSTFKAWIDRVARAGITFKYTEQGPQGLLTDKKVVVIAARGGIYQGTPADTQSQYLKDVFAFIGLTNIEFVYAEGLNMPNKEQGLATARSTMDNIISRL